MDRPTEEYPRIYTAGAMRWENGEDSWWRRSVEDSLSEITFYHPEDTYFDHGGDYVRGAVSEDIQAINAADGVVAYFSEKPQIGTTVETMHAIHTETPTLVLFDEDLLGPPVTTGGDVEYPDQTEEPEYPKPVGNAEFRALSDDHWFLINYLNGDSDSGQRFMPDWISNWDGYPDASVQAVAETEDIEQAVEEWINSEFGTIPDE